MDNKKFILIYAILILIIIGIVIYSIVYTIKKENLKNNVNISIEEFNNKVLEIGNFKSSKFNDITNYNIYEVFEIKSDDLVKFFGKKAILNTNSELYLLVQPKDEKYDEVYLKLEEFGIKYQNEWSNYLEAEYDIVVDRKIGKMNKFIYVIISENSNDILKEIGIVK